MDKMEWRTQQARPSYRRWVESSPACVACVCGMCAACGGPGGLPLGSAVPLCCHSDATRAPIANPPNSAQPRGSPYHSPKLHPGPCNSVGMRPQTDRHTDRQTHTHTQMRVTTIHFSRSTTHAKCNNSIIAGAMPTKICALFPSFACAPEFANFLRKVSVH